MLQSILDTIYKMSLWEAALWLLVENVLIFVLALLIGSLLVKLFRNRPVAQPTSSSRLEIWLSLSVVVLNSLVTLAGWVLWKADWIKLRTDLDWQAGLDSLVLFGVMDFFMYLFHRVAHLPPFYDLIHQTHHKFENPRPLTLFALNPFENLGFGALWLLVLVVYPASWFGISVYLTLNVVFGLIGHLGVEPFPNWWVKIPIIKEISTSTFHAQHHRETFYNFGFYTLIWDKLFGTLSPNYPSGFGQISAKPMISTNSFSTRLDVTD